MPPWLKVLLPLGLVAYLGVVIVLRSWLHRRRTGASPVVVPLDDTVHGFIGRALLVLAAGIVVDVALALLSDRAHRLLAPITWLERDELRLAAIVVLAIALVWITVAQVQMGPSFRIGIDQKNRTDLVARGLYRVSRNPIYVGMMASLLCFLLLLPNALTLLLVGVAFVLIHIQTRLEEEHLARLHGEPFEEYRRRVPRWL